MADTTICDDCIFADWKRTSNGRLHPDKTGRCKAEIPEIVIPASFYWLSSYTRKSPRPSGGYIERGQTIDRACPYKRTEHST